MKLVKLVKVNNLQYNPQHNVEIYRVTPNQDFRIQALLGGEGSAHCRFLVEGEPRCDTTVERPGTFECRFSFPTPGVRIGELVVEGSGQTFTQTIRLDVVDHAWVG